MADLKLSFSVSLVAAVILGELVSVLWYSDHTPWGRYGGDRYLITAIVCDVGMALLLQHIMGSYWSVRGWEDAAFLAVALTLLFICLEAPHAVHGSRSLSRFLYHALHKGLVMFVMVLALHHFARY